MKLEDAKIKQILVEGGYISEEDAKKADDIVKKTGKDFLSVIFDLDLITGDLLGQAIAEHFGLIYADLNSHVPSKEQVLKVPEKIAKENRIIIFFEDEKEVIITTDNPTNPNLRSLLARMFPRKEVYLAYSLTEDIENVFKYYQKNLDTRFSKIIEGEQKVAPEIIKEIIEDALSFKVSDIHFDPREEEVVVRFRIDGVMREVGRIPSSIYVNILNRIKVQAHLRIDEHFAAQDGAIRFLSGGTTVDMRISIVPALDGEKLVIRMLAKYIQDLDITNLGLSDENEKILTDASRSPFGMILVVGPTGSGKTTTLYSLLRTLNRPEVNIATIEDPVEYKIEGVNHIQVNPQTNLTFAKGLRSIVRQDPDIILVGEIRDEETAEISVNAALTGHLLLSTFHANDAATAIPRLFDMGVEQFLLSSTMELIIGQRLARKICEECKYSYPFTGTSELVDDELLSKFIKKGDRLYKGKGCDSCNKTGYKGRSAIFEMIRMTPEMRELILENPSSQDIWELASSQGAKSLFEDGIRKIKSGETTLEELLRVAQPPELRKEKNAIKKAKDVEKKTK
jgi:type IV pilus assembly protein PilB